MALARDDRLRFGVCWYPEHWPEERWATDLDAMAEMGLSCVRLGESCWQRIEPAEGTFDFGLLDAAIAAAAERGLGVVLGTPTYAAPAWLVQAYPEALAKREDGSPWYHLSRRCYDYTDPDYRRCCRNLVQALAEHYAGDERVWAWQVDNEIWCHLGELWGPSVTRSFQAWCAAHYGSISALNEAWGLEFWGGNKATFEQIDLPGPTPAAINQHHLADFRRFSSDLAIEFLQEQIDVIKSFDAASVVLHNYPFDPIDRPELLGRLDVYGHDHYPKFADEPVHRPSMGLNYGRFRAHSQRLWVMEQQSSQIGNVSQRKPTCAPGELAVTALQSIGHGADLLAWFRWRSYPAAQEINWGGLLPHWGEPGRHFAEARGLITALSPHAKTIAGTTAFVEVARVCSFRQRLANQGETWMAEAIGSVEAGQEALRGVGFNENQVRPLDLVPGDTYRIALLPYALGLDDAEIAALDRWVLAGGTLVVGPLAGYRDARLHGPDVPPPGALGWLTGTRNSESSTWNQDLVIHAADGGPSASVGRYGEILEPNEDVTVCARYATSWFAGHAAITERPHGRGRVIHCGIPLGNTTLSWLWGEGVLPRPGYTLSVYDPAAEVLTRQGAGYRLHFALNHGEGPAVFNLQRPLKDLISGAQVTGSFTLEFNEWRLLREDLDPAATNL